MPSITSRPMSLDNFEKRFSAYALHSEDSKIMRSCPLPDELLLLISAFKGQPIPGCEGLEKLGVYEINKKWIPFTDRLIAEKDIIIPPLVEGASIEDEKAHNQARYKKASAKSLYSIIMDIAKPYLKEDGTVNNSVVLRKIFEFFQLELNKLRPLPFEDFVLSETTDVDTLIKVHDYIVNYNLDRMKSKLFRITQLDVFGEDVHVNEARAFLMNEANLAILNAWEGEPFYLINKGLTSVMGLGCFWKMTNLCYLNLSHNSLTSLPSEIGRCERLIFLDLSNNSLTTLPSEIGRCERLIFLDLTHNSLTSLPPETGNCKRLVGLKLAHNGLTSLPSEIGGCVNLSVLDLSNNRLASLPPEIGRCDRIEILTLDHNNLTSLPPDIACRFPIAFNN